MPVRYTSLHLVQPDPAICASSCLLSCGPGQLVSSTELAELAGPGGDSTPHFTPPGTYWPGQLGQLSYMVVYMSIGYWSDIDPSKQIKLLGSTADRYPVDKSFTWSFICQLDIGPTSTRVSKQNFSGQRQTDIQSTFNTYQRDIKPTLYRVVSLLRIPQPLV